MYLFPLLLLLWHQQVISSAEKLNVPKLLLPASARARYELRVVDPPKGACYSWTSLNEEVARVEAASCGASAIVSATWENRGRSPTAMVIAEETTSRLTLRCDIIVDVITEIAIESTTLQLYLEDSPEAFLLKGLDRERNTFSTLGETPVDWSILTDGKNLPGNKVLRIVRYADSPYEAPLEMASLEMQGLSGYSVLVEGLQTGSAIVQAALTQSPEVKDVSRRLFVVANIVIQPPTVWLLPNATVQFRVFLVRQGHPEEIPLPSPQYALEVNDLAIGTLHISQFSAVKLGSTNVHLVDSHLGHPELNPSRAIVHVVSPAFLAFRADSWMFRVGDVRTVFVDVQDSKGHMVRLSSADRVTLTSPAPGLTVLEASENGTVLTLRAERAGQWRLRARLIWHDSDLVQEQAVEVYEPVVVSPHHLAVVWPGGQGSVAAKGGSGEFRWSVATPAVMAATIVRCGAEGTATIEAWDSRSPSNRDNATVKCGPLQWEAGSLRHTISASPLSVSSLQVFTESRNEATVGVVCGSLSGDKKATVTVTNHPTSDNPHPRSEELPLDVFCREPTSARIVPHLKTPAGVPRCPATAEYLPIPDTGAVQLGVKLYLDKQPFYNFSSLALKWNSGQLKKTTPAETIVDASGKPHTSQAFSLNSGASSQFAVELVVGSLRAAANLMPTAPLVLTPTEINLLSLGSSRGELQLEGGSSHTHLEHDATLLDLVRHSPRVIHLSPLEVGRSRVTVRDLCVRPEQPQVAAVHVTALARVTLRVRPRLQQGEKCRALLTATDSAGQLVPTEVLSQLEFVVEGDGVSVEVAGVEKDSLVFTITGRAVGQGTLTARILSVRADPQPLQVFSPISLVPATLYLVPGGSHQLRVTGGPRPPPAFAFTHTNHGMAEINQDSGYVESLQLGSSVVSVTFADLDTIDDKTITYQCELPARVEVIPLRSARLSAPTQLLEVGNTVPITVLLNNGVPASAAAPSRPQLQVLWTQTAGLVAPLTSSLPQSHDVTVHYTPRREGASTIRAKVTRDAGHGQPAFTAMVEITITAVEPLRLGCSDDLLLAVGAKYQLPSGPSYSSKGAALSVTTSGVVTALVAGEAVLRATRRDGLLNQTVATVVQVEAHAAFSRLRLVSPLSLNDVLTGIPAGSELGVVVVHQNTLGRTFTAVRSEAVARLNEDGAVTLSPGGAAAYTLIISPHVDVKWQVLLLDNTVASSLRPVDVVSTSSNNFVGDLVCLKSVLNGEWLTHEGALVSDGTALLTDDSDIVLRQGLRDVAAVNIKVSPLKSIALIAPSYDQLNPKRDTIYIQVDLSPTPSVCRDTASSAGELTAGVPIVCHVSADLALSGIVKATAILSLREQLYYCRVSLTQPHKDAFSFAVDVSTISGDLQSNRVKLSFVPLRAEVVSTPEPGLRLDVTQLGVLLFTLVVGIIIVAVALCLRSHANPGYMPLPSEYRYSPNVSGADLSGFRHSPHSPRLWSSGYTPDVISSNSPAEHHRRTLSN